MFSSLHVLMVYTYRLFKYLPRRNVYSDSLPIFLNWVNYIFGIVFLEILYIFYIQVPNQIYDLQIFSPILWVVFSLSCWCPLKHKFCFDQV